MSEEPKERRCIAAVRIRGAISAPLQVRETLQMLNLKRNNYAVLIDNRPSFLGMLKTAQNFITWGEVSKETVLMLLKKRGRLVGDKKLTDEFAKKNGYNSIEELAEAIFNCKVEYWKLRDVQPFFRLHPPTKGFRGKIKKGYGMGGELGYRGEKINELLKRMI
ncbi:MAG: 50S ribosomal protein L30 [Nitrososphaerota archaeon]|nr:50S ribosomal protein L30 [Candidatus Bathyarchaeota archaeon]MDW8023134.1 50S ribosomal protein L30 [Nitrososphaerota archaeon]